MPRAGRLRLLPCLALAALAFGCAHLDRYVSPPPSSSLQARQALLQKHAVRVDDNGTAEAQGRTVWNVASYAARDAPAQSAGLPWSGWGLRWWDAAWIAAVALVADQAQGRSNEDYEGYYVPALGLAVLWETDLVSREADARAADARAFDTALARDLGLDEGWVDQFIALPDAYPDETRLGGRFGLSLDSTRVSALDEQAFFAPAAGPDARLPDEWTSGAGAFWGWRFLSGWTPGFAFSWQGREARQGALASVAGADTQTLQLADYQFAATLGTAFRLGRAGRLSLSLAPQISCGLALLSGQVQAFDGQGRGLGASSITAWTPALGASVRLVPSLLRMGSYYLEAGWIWCRFSQAQINGSNGDLAGLGGVLPAADGRAAAWDFSGPVIKTGVLFF